MAVLSKDKTYVTVERGDTLSEIARDYGNGKTYQQLAAINGIENPDLIYVDQKILLNKPSSPSSSTSKEEATQVTITHFGLQADVESTLFVTWSWSRSKTEHYEVRWDYYTADKYWFVGEETTTEHKYSTYVVPSNAKQVRVRIRPISTKNKKDVSYWTAEWTGWKKYSHSVPPKTPTSLSVKLEGLKLTAEVRNLESDPSIVQFEIVKDDGATYKTGKASVKTAAASYSCTVVAGSAYKVRCRAYKNSLYSEWSSYSDNYDTIPSTPAKFTKCEPGSIKDPVSIHLEWPSVANADSYDIEYTTKKSNFDGSDQVTSKNTGGKGSSYELSSGIELGKEYFFRIRAVNANGTSGWSEVSSTVIGTGPAAPTTWSSTTTVVTGEPLTLYWTHNSEDGSKLTYSHIEIYVNDNLTVNEQIENKSSDNSTGSYEVKMVDDSGNPIYPEGASIRWRVRTAGISSQYGEYSVLRTVDVYAKPWLELSVTDANGEAIEFLGGLPFKVSALAGPNTQRPIGYYLCIIAKASYETVDDVGNVKTVNEGEEVYSKHFDISEPLDVELSASDLSLENGVDYTLVCKVSMNSGLTTESEFEFSVSWAAASYVPNAEIGIDSDTLSAYIRPYCAGYKLVHYKVSYEGYLYYRLTETIDGVYGEPVQGATTVGGEQVYFGTSADGEVLYYCSVEEEVLNEDVLLSVYRREFDGSFTELAKDLDGAANTFITDPHPALDYARYRIVSTSKQTGAVNYYDMPGYPVGEKAIIIQWDEAWSNFDDFGTSDMLEQPPWTGSLLRLPYNIDTSSSYESDVELVKYIGRKRPVAYYGTQIGETGTWNVEIDADDTETRYGLRRLAAWTGNVYVREPSGSGYWANVKVSFGQKHCEVTIPVTIEVTRVEGGA